MGDLAQDTMIEGGEGRYVVELSEDWKVWGPMGGYLGAIALRAAGAASKLRRPAAIACHFLDVAKMSAVEVRVESLRASRRAESSRVSITQAGVAILEALVWTVDDREGLTHRDAEMPKVPPPDELKSLEELMGREALERSPAALFFRNFEERPTSWNDAWMQREGGEARWTNWMRYRPTPRFDDPFVHAGAQLILLDLGMWFAASMAYPSQMFPLIGPSLDLRASFHTIGTDEEWFLADGYSPLASNGLLGAQGRTWASDGRLLASGAQQMLCRPQPIVPA
jgi:acyl-CoA thioesterase II